MNTDDLNLAHLFKQKNAGVDISSVFFEATKPAPELCGADTNDLVAPVASPVRIETHRPLDASGRGEDSDPVSLDAGVAGGRETLQALESIGAGGSRRRSGTVGNDRANADQKRTDAGGVPLRRARSAQGVGTRPSRARNGAALAAKCPPVLIGGSFQAPAPASRVDYITFTCRFSENKKNAVFVFFQRHIIPLLAGGEGDSIRSVSWRQFTLNSYLDGMGVFVNRELLCGVFWGGNCNTMQVEIKGDLCDRMEYHHFVLIYRVACHWKVKVTRCDHAIDFWGGEVNHPKWFLRQYSKGGKCARQFWDRRGPLPQEGWIDLGRGASFYIGAKEATWRLRIYEKGKELGDMNSNWVRVELQMKDEKRAPLPIEVLDPDNTMKFICGLGPFWAQLIPSIEPMHRKTLRRPGFEKLSTKIISSVRYFHSHLGGAFFYLADVLGDSVAMQILKNEHMEWGAVKGRPEAYDEEFRESLASRLIEEFLPVLPSIVLGGGDDPIPF